MRESEGKGEVGEKRGKKRENREGGGGGRRERKKVREEKGGRGQRDKQESMTTCTAGTCSCSSSGMLTALLRW